VETRFVSVQLVLPVMISAVARAGAMGASWSPIVVTAAMGTVTGLAARADVDVNEQPDLNSNEEIEQ
ncbi:MAG TPA: hypothetical protein VFD49_13480, partial [Candidatus Dormibacteraeota bacterium]|nr:hypothetical protein [Candidatus Dormibacteraeota bacterium]